MKKILARSSFLLHFFVQIQQCIIGNFAFSHIKQIEKVCNDLHLLSGTQIAGIDSVKVQI